MSYQQEIIDHKLYFTMCILVMAWFWYHTIADDIGQEKIELPVINMPEYDFDENIIINYFLAYATSEQELINECHEEDSNYCFFIPYFDISKENIDESFCTELLIYMENGTLCRILEEPKPTSIPALDPCPNPDYPRYHEATKSCGEPLSYLFQLKFTNEEYDSMFNKTNDLITNGTHVTWTTNFGSGDDDELTEEKGWHVADPIMLDIDLYKDNLIPKNLTEYEKAKALKVDVSGINDSSLDQEKTPEFGTIAMMILAIAIISIIAVTAKSRIVPRF